MAECVAPSRGFAAAAEKLLNILGYDSDRKDDLSGDVAEFMREYPDPNNAAETQSARQFRDAADRVNIVFQFAESEISQGELGERIEFDKGSANSFLFVAADLKKGRYSRSDYASFVREINKRFSAPTVALFRRPESKDKAVLTLAFVGRRQSQTQHGRDVLEKVSLLREIQCDDPHRGHLDILAELSFAKRVKWMRGENKLKNFDGLLAAWLDELDAEALNRRFYGDLREWFKMARDNAVFPCPLSKSRDKAECAKAAADSVIRLITRMMFIWFIKEKKLVADQLFSESQISPLLAKYDAAEGDTYYRAILQNLFFATLNTDIDDRRFSNRNNDDHRNPNLFRYKDLMSDSDAILKLMNQTPFINGGLFDCLDDFEGVLAGGKRVDCFTDNPSQRKELRVPNTLFFSKEKENLGLLTIFKRYKFTVEENTPVEQEVALDPELLGKVFENLLAEEIKPEARQSDRKLTGSFYTPRVVVDYMADESLSAYLAAKVPGNGDRQWRHKLRDLFDYAKTGCENIAKDKIARLVGAVADIKVLDPACGSGAFPMGVLNKLALALSKLDPENKEWEKLQKKRAAAAAHDAFYSVHGQEARAFRLKEVNNTFADYSETFGRKLFLIQNSIFGSDIQPVACQIAKLRFFISLAIEQEKKDDKKNYGIRPLPNLETRFVAADTLIGIGGANPQGELGGDKIAKLQKQLAKNRERHFNASVRAVKLQLRKRDKRLRCVLAKRLERIPGFEPAARGIAAWNPYNQNDAADWFDPEWMFGIGGGFDVVIGNPPYVDSENMTQKNRAYRETLSEIYDTAAGNWDLFVPFIERGVGLLDKGFLAFIVPNKLLSQPYAKRIRGLLAQNNIIEIRDYSHLQVFEAGVCPITLMVQSGGRSDGKTRMIVMKTVNDIQSCRLVDNISFSEGGAWSIYFSGKKELDIIQKINRIKTRAVGEFANPASVADAYKIKQFLLDAAQCAQTKKMINSGLIDRYVSHWGRKPMQYIKGRYQFPHVSEADIATLSPKRVRESNSPKLIFASMTRYLEVFLDSSGEYMAGKSTAIYMSPSADDLRAMLAVMNSKVVSFWYRKTFHATKMGVGLQITRPALSQVPIPEISTGKQKRLSDLAEKIIAAKAANPPTSTREMEDEIDEMVYALYDLTPDEIAIIESSAP